MKKVKIKFIANGKESHEDFNVDSNSVSLNSAAITSIDLYTLSQFDSLKHFSLSRNLLQEINLSTLSDCSSLNSIDLSQNQLSTVDLDPLNHCSELEAIILSRNKLSSLNLTPLSNCSRLTYFDFSNNQLQTVDLYPLTNCENLQYLDISENELRATDLSSLSEHSNLQSLFLNGNNIENVDLNALVGCQNLEVLDLADNNLREFDMQNMDQYSHLRYLDLSGNQISEIDLSGLSHHHDIKRLYLNDNQLQNIDLTPLKEISGLQVLGIGNNPMSSLDLSQLGDSIELKALWLNGLGLSQADLSPLSQCRNLEGLWLNDNQLSEIDLSSLAESSSLNRVDLSGNPNLTIDIPQVRHYNGFTELILDPNVYRTHQTLIGEEFTPHISTIDAVPDSSIVFSRFQNRKTRIQQENILDDCFQINHSKAEEMFNKVVRAKTNDEKKNSLEDLAEYFFNCVDGFQVKPGKRTATGEIDRIVRNNRVDHPLFKWIGMNFILEAKNWRAKVNAREIAVIANKMRLAGCNLGVLFARAGITGKKGKDAMGAISQAFIKDRIVVAVIDSSDLRNIIEGENLLELLRCKVEDVQYSL